MDKNIKIRILLICTIILGVASTCNDVNCATCDGDPAVCTLCTSGYYVNGNGCTGCISNCNVCSAASPTTCDTCS
jgi:hypothetical protein